MVPWRTAVRLISANASTVQEEAPLLFNVSQPVIELPMATEPWSFLNFPLDIFRVLVPAATPTKELPVTFRLEADTPAALVEPSPMVRSLPVPTVSVPLAVSVELPFKLAFVLSRSIAEALMAPLVLTVTVLPVTVKVELGSSFALSFTVTLPPVILALLLGLKLLLLLKDSVLLEEVKVPFTVTAAVLLVVKLPFVRVNPLLKVALAVLLIVILSPLEVVPPLTENVALPVRV